MTVNKNCKLSISIAASLADEQAVHVGVQEVQDAASAAGWSVCSGGDASVSHLIEVGLSTDAKVAPVQPGTLPTLEEQCYRIRTTGEGGKTITSIIADGVLGAAYGLIWLADRLRTGHTWPPEDADCRPLYPQRFGFLHLSFVPQDEPPYVDMERSKGRIQHAIRQLDYVLLSGGTGAIFYDTQYLIPWDDPKYGPRSAACRELLAELIDASHARRLRIYPMGDEFLYLPDWFKRTGATFSTDDPKLWEALKSKYRGLLKELPEIDGVLTRVGEVIPRGDIMAWDIIHTGEDRSLEGNYRRFIKAMYDVVVDEFDRHYIHRTWMVNTSEQASVPWVYERTFTSEIPTDKILISIKLTTGDQWEWQPINPTFGLTPHDNIAQVETGRAQDYFSGPPDIAVEFVQAGLEWALEHGAMATMINNRAPWEENLFSCMEYVAWRLAWDPYQPLREIVADWVSATVGPEIAERVADMILDLDDIYRDGFHVRGASYHTWEPLRHVRTGWICKGNPYLDRGRGQHRFLRDHYLMAKPELELALRMMDEHTARYDRWLDSYRTWVKELPDPDRGRWLDVILARGRDALHINLAYVTAFLRYFDYEDNTDELHRERAVEAVHELEEELKGFRSRSLLSKSSFMAADNVQGIVEFLRFAKLGLEDVDRLKEQMANAPDEEEMQRIIEEAKKRDESLIEQNPDALLFARWKGIIDGRDLFRIDVDKGVCTIEHLLGDSASGREFDIAPRPSGPGRYAVKLVEGQERGWGYIVEQPSDENGNLLLLLMNDDLPGYGPYEVHIYWIAG